MLLTFTNVGSLGSDNPEELKPDNMVVRQQLFDTLATISNDIEPPDILCLQECRSFSFEPTPFFKGPVATSSHVTHGANEGGTRGVSIYSNKFSSTIDLNDDVHEACALKFQYRANSGRNKDAAVINIYRNQSKNFTRTIEDTRAFLT